MPEWCARCNGHHDGECHLPPISKPEPRILKCSQCKHLQDMLDDQRGTNAYLTQEYADLYAAYEELKGLIRESAEPSH